MDYERNLVAAWDMSTINPPDLGWKDNGNDGVGSGLVASTDIVEGIAGGKALHFRGNDRVTIADSLSLRAGATLTIAFWIKPDAAGLGVAQLILAKRDAGGIEYQCFTANDDTLRFFVAGTEGVFNFDLSSYAGQWLHVVYIADGATWYLYVNGEVDPIIFAGVALVSGDADITIGEYFNGTADMQATLDSVRIYSAALTPMQVTDLYNKTRQGRA